MKPRNSYRGRDDSPAKAPAAGVTKAAPKIPGVAKASPELSKDEAKSQALKNTFLELLWTEFSDSDIHRLLSNSAKAATKTVTELLWKELSDSDIHRLLKKTHIFSGHVAAILMRLEAMEDAQKRVDRLTARQKAVLEHLSNGKTNKQIASLLCLGTRTVDAHIAGIFKRLEVKSRTIAALIYDRLEPTGGVAFAVNIEPVGRSDRPPL